MDYAYLPPRMDPAALSGNAALRLAPDAMSSKAETARPVVAVERSIQSSASKSGGFKPLDTFEVGDNDDIPVPPDPPRKARLQTIINSLPPSETPDVDAPNSGAPSVDHPDATAPALDAPNTPTEKAEPLTAALRDIDPGQNAPTFDIRR